jgi:hypothetical protein
VRSMPFVRGLERRYAPRGLRVIGVHKWTLGDGEARAGIDAARQAHRARWPTYLDADGALEARYGGLTLPAFYLVGRDGTFRWMQSGTLVAGGGEANDLVREIRAALDG